jgi:acyl carrier protein
VIGLGSTDAAREVATTDDRRAAAPAQAESSWAFRVLQAGPGDRVDLLREMVRAQIMTILRLSPDSPPSRRDRLMDLGMDSLMAVRLRNTLTQALQLERPLPSTLIFSYPTIDAIADHLHALLQKSAAPPFSPLELSTLENAEDLNLEAAAVPSDAEIVRLLDERMGSL